MSSSHPRSNRITNSREMVEGNQAMKLYSHPSSSCSRRVRLALKLKGLEYDCINISSTSDPGEITTRYMHFTLRNLNGKTHILYQNGIKFYTISKTNIVKDELLEVNPMGYVPALVDGTAVISDSYAILLYLEEKYPMHPLLPKDLTTRAINYQIASIVSSSIQPLQNMTLVNYIGEIAGLEEKLPWAQHHIRKGFIALEKLLVNYVGKYATGDDIYLADLYLAPQLHNAINRYKVDMTEFPLLISLNETYSKVPSFQQIMV